MMAGEEGGGMKTPLFDRTQVGGVMQATVAHAATM